MSKKLKVGVQFLIGLAFTYVLYFLVDFEVLREIVLNTDLGILCWAVISVSIHPIFVTIRWHLLLRFFSHETYFKDNLIVNVYGTMLQNIFPGGVGIDVARIAKNDGVSRKEIFALTMIDKLVLVFLSITLYIVFLLKINEISILMVLLSLIIIAICLGGCLITYKIFHKRFFERENIVNESKSLWMFVFVSFMTLINFMWIGYLIFLAVNVLPKIYDLLGIPFIIAVSSLPVSPGGFGVREWAAAKFLAPYSELSTEVYLIMALYFGTMTIVGTVITSFFLWLFTLKSLAKSS